MNTPEEQQYIRDNTNWWDRFSMNLIYVPVFLGLVIVAVGLVAVAIYNVEVELTKKFLYLWVPIAVICSGFNIRGARKIARLLREYRNNANEG